MKFSIVHFEKPSSANTTHNSSDNVLSFSQQNSLKHHSFSSNNASFSGGRKSPPNQKLVMTRRTEILEPLKKLDDLKQIQLSIIQQRLAQSNSSSQSRKSPELNSSTTKVAQSLLNQSIVSRRTVPPPQTIPSQHTHVILHSPVNTVHYEQATATLAIPIIYQHQTNLQIPHNHHPMLIPNTIKYQAPQNYHHLPVNTPPKPACTVSYERVVSYERPHAPSTMNPPHQHHAPSSLALQAKSAQEHSPHPPPQYSKQTISKPSKMSENASCGRKIKRVSISFNELLNEDHEFKSSH
ncbi:predicted protein [Naegleria gruberi]|uniref:Predicted protein n=1 Tax=Naegleria gruberi TaxID=5762 RepID=D2V288_NAEGR|nr:uncharacterized protein NAEGRDRAFT_62917 [Naegleria gruberi]EFC49013.1 predicted protein [Naegleria gruberi]|eukprot:XP_002681757.1 predicted protein [Naegleria gruberi strain NEG-M]